MIIYTMMFQYCTCTYRVLEYTKFEGPPKKPCETRKLSLQSNSVNNYILRTVMQIRSQYERVAPKIPRKFFPRIKLNAWPTVSNATDRSNNTSIHPFLKSIQA